MVWHRVCFKALAARLLYIVLLTLYAQGYCPGIVSQSVKSSYSYYLTELFFSKNGAERFR